MVDGGHMPVTGGEQALVTQHYQWPGAVVLGKHNNLIATPNKNGNSSITAAVYKC